MKFPERCAVHAQPRICRSRTRARVYLAIKLAVLALGVLLALHFLWGVV